MNLVIDIGNTQAKVAWFDAGELIKSKRFAGITPLDLPEIFSRHSIDRAILSSVGDGRLNFLVDACRKLQFFVELDHNTPLPLKLNYHTPETLGFDRVAAAAGAWYHYPGVNLLVIDMGTAITVDWVSANGAYLGGNISPGIQIRFRALHEFTAKLPLVEVNHLFPDTGKDTHTAIAAGVQWGVIHELSGYINKFESLYPGGKIVVTGGNAAVFVPRLNRSAILQPDLVVTGLNYILDYNASKRS